jgi:hypothetical protein
VIMKVPESRVVQPPHYFQSSTREPQQHPDASEKVIRRVFKLSTLSDVPMLSQENIL